MIMDNSYSMGQFSDPSFEFPQYPDLASTPWPMPKKPMPKKPRHQRKRLSKYKLSVQGPRYSDDVIDSINFNFVVQVGNTPTVCNYSKKFKKLYLSTNCILRIKFNWSPAFEPLFLRSAVLFADENQRVIPVQRCYTHMDPKLEQNAGVGYDQIRHVFRVSDPVSFYESSYETDMKGNLSTRTMLRAESGESMIDYQFCCQNSCSTGINRRATKMVFVIENSMGVVVAKRSMLVQICSIPKRDLERDESRVSSNSKKSKKKKLSQQQSPLPPLPPNKFSDSCENDETVYSLSIDVLGEENYRAVLKYAYDVMAAQALRTGNHQLLKPHMDAILIKEQLADH